MLTLIVYASRIPTSPTQISGVLPPSSASHFTCTARYFPDYSRLRSPCPHLLKNDQDRSHKLDKGNSWGVLGGSLEDPWIVPGRSLVACMKTQQTKSMEAGTSNFCEAYRLSWFSGVLPPTLAYLEQTRAQESKRERKRAIRPLGGVLGRLCGLLGQCWSLS